MDNRENRKMLLGLDNPLRDKSNFLVRANRFSYPTLDDSTSIDIIKKFIAETYDNKEQTSRSMKMPAFNMDFVNEIASRRMKNSRQLFENENGSINYPLQTKPYRIYFSRFVEFLSITNSFSLFSEFAHRLTVYLAARKICVHSRNPKIFYTEFLSKRSSSLDEIDFDRDVELIRQIIDSIDYLNLEDYHSSRSDHIYRNNYMYRQSSKSQEYFKEASYSIDRKSAQICNEFLKRCSQEKIKYRTYVGRSMPYVISSFIEILILLDNEKIKFKFPEAYSYFEEMVESFEIYLFKRDLLDYLKQNKVSKHEEDRVNLSIESLQREKIFQSLKNIEKSGTSGRSDGNYYRREQDLLRKYHVQGRKSLECSICRNIFSENSLVLAHKKLRSKATDEERTDVNIAFLLCKYGCDHLFEHSIIVVEEGTVKINTKISKGIISSFEYNYAKNLEGNRIPDDCNSGNSENYFSTRY